MGHGQSHVAGLAAPMAEEAGLDLLAVEVKASGPRQLVRVIVDRKGGVTVDACQALSRRLAEALDAQDPIEGRYALEVTSPGVDYPLSDQRSFDRVEGRLVLVHREAGDGRTIEVRGTVEAAEAEAVVLRTDQDTVRVPYTEVVKASQALPW